MEHWHSKSLGDGMWTDVPSEEIKLCFQPLFVSAGTPIEMVAFTRHEEESLHCEWITYFFPAVAEVAIVVEAVPCKKPIREGLILLAGNDECWIILFEGA